MRSTTERRQRILESLYKRKVETMSNLAFEFSVSRSTIRRDIEILSLTFPLYTVQGKYGGVGITEDYRIRGTYLTDNQKEVLLRVAEKANEEDKIVVLGIIKIFERPKEKH